VTDSAEQRLHDALDALVPTYRGHLQELVRIPSPIGSEGAAQDVVARLMSAIGLSVDVFDIDPSALSGVAGFTAPGRHYAGRPCVVGTLKGSGGGRSLALNAHIDTAPIDPAGTWTHPPYSGAIDGDHLFGRGAWDDKAGVIECVMVADAVKRSGLDMRGDLVIQIVVEDEATGNGTLACLARGHRADAAIIVDGTWPERFIVSHMGQIWFRVDLHGRSAPASVGNRGSHPLLP
jgi:acetylornithine deacetylase